MNVPAESWMVTGPPELSEFAVIAARNEFAVPSSLKSVTEIGVLLSIHRVFEQFENRRSSVQNAANRPLTSGCFPPRAFLPSSDACLRKLPEHDAHSFAKKSD